MRCNMNDYWRCDSDYGTDLWIDATFTYSAMPTESVAQTITTMRVMNPNVVVPSEMRLRSLHFVSSSSELCLPSRLSTKNLK